MDNSHHHDSSDTESENNDNQAAWTGLLDPLVNAAPLRAAIPGAAVNESPSDAHVRIGLVNRTKEFPSRAEAKTFIRKNMFAGSKGEPCAEFALHYERFTCSQCDFHCRVHFEDPAIADTLKTGKCLLEVPGLLNGVRPSAGFRIKSDPDGRPSVHLTRTDLETGLIFEHVWWQSKCLSQTKCV